MYDQVKLFISKNYRFSWLEKWPKIGQKNTNTLNSFSIPNKKSFRVASEIT
jgi:hypothetical protein